MISVALRHVALSESDGPRTWGPGQGARPACSSHLICSCLSALVASHNRYRTFAFRVSEIQRQEDASIHSIRYWRSRCRLPRIRAGRCRLQVQRQIQLSWVAWTGTDTMGRTYSRPAHRLYVAQVQGMGRYIWTNLPNEDARSELCDNLG